MVSKLFVKGPAVLCLESKGRQLAAVGAEPYGVYPYLRRYILMTPCRTETNGGSLTIQLLLQPSVSGVAVSLQSGFTVDILSTFSSVFQCVNWMLKIFEFGV